MITQFIDHSHPCLFRFALCEIGEMCNTYLDTYTIHRGNFLQKALTIFDYPLSYSEDIEHPPTLPALLDACDVLFVLADFSKENTLKHIYSLKAELDAIPQKPRLTFFVTLTQYADEQNLQAVLNDGHRYIFVDNPSLLLAPLDIFVAYTGTQTTYFGIEYCDLYAIVSAHTKFYLTRLRKPNTKKLFAAHSAYMEDTRNTRDRYCFAFHDMIRLDTMRDYRNLEEHESLVFEEVDYWSIPENVFFLFSFNVDENDKTATCTTLFCLT